MKKGSIIVLVGISGSGKSTIAEKLCRGNEDTYIRVNRDKIREQLFSYSERNVYKYYEDSNWLDYEKTVSIIEESNIRKLLSKGKLVIVDNTHLKLKYIKKYFRYGVAVEVRFVDVDYDTAVERDLSRERTVGEKVILDQYQKYQKVKIAYKDWVENDMMNEISVEGFVFNDDLPSAFIFDIDGTLAEMTNRSPYDWDRVGEDKVRLSVKKTLIGLKDSGYPIIICTGRDGSCEEITKEWLYVNDIPYDEFYIRTEDDMRPDWVVKQEMWVDINKKYRVIAMFDDRDQVVDHARLCGFDVFQVNEGNF